MSSYKSNGEYARAGFFTAFGVWLFMLPVIGGFLFGFILVRVASALLS